MRVEPDEIHRMTWIVGGTFDPNTATIDINSFLLLGLQEYV